MQKHSSLLFPFELGFPRVDHSNVENIIHGDEVIFNCIFAACHNGSFAYLTLLWRFSTHRTKRIIQLFSGKLFNNMSVVEW